MLGQRAEAVLQHETVSISHLAMYLAAVRGRENLGTKLITRMPIFDGTSSPIYYTEAVLGLRARAQGIS